VHAQGDYAGTCVERAGPGLGPVNFSGWYAQAGWFITGESRSFDVRDAKFKRIHPRRKIGAWEVAVRWSEIDLQSKDVLGGEEQNLTVGLNWWANDNVMVRFNYVRAWVDPTSAYLQPFPITLVPNPFAGIDDDFNAFMARAQIVF